MTRICSWILALFVCASSVVTAQDVVSMDGEAHYALAFSNEYCRAYTVTLGRLETTKPVAYPHDWVRITLGGNFEQAWGGTLFSQRGSEDPGGYYIQFLSPVGRLTLRNPRNDPYSAIVVQIMKGDDSRYRMNDASLDPLATMLGPGVDTYHSYQTTLSKTSVTIKSVQVIAGEPEKVRFGGAGSLLIAITDVNLEQQGDGSDARDFQLSKGEMGWLPPGPTTTFKNTGKQPARFAILEFK